jgi:hypothetical protein
MAINWGVAYEAPISLDAPRLIGTRARRPTLWTMAAFAVVIPVGAAIVVTAFPAIQVMLPDWIPGAVIGAAFFTGLWVMFCYVMGSTWGQRSAEYWLKRWIRHRRLPKRLDGSSLAKHHANVSLRLTEHRHAEHVIDADNYPRAVVEIQTSNLQMRDAETLAGFIKQFHMFLLSLQFPIRIVEGAPDAAHGRAATGKARRASVERGSVRLTAGVLGRKVNRAADRAINSQA